MNKPIEHTMTPNSPPIPASEAPGEFMTGDKKTEGFPKKLMLKTTARDPHMETVKIGKMIITKEPQEFLVSKEDFDAITLPGGKGYSWVEVVKPEKPEKK